MESDILFLDIFPFSAIKAFLISFPSSDLIGIFCRFGLLDANLPVFVAASKNEVCTLLVLELMCSCNASVYVFLSFEICLHSKTNLGNL